MHRPPGSCQIAIWSALWQVSSAMALQLDSRIPEMVDSRIPVRTVVRQMGAGRAEEKESRKRLYAEATTLTIHGTVMQSEEITRNGQTATIYFADIRALLVMLAQISLHFGNFLWHHCKRACTLLLYMDKCVPGNCLRPDTGRAFEAFPRGRPGVS